MKSSKSNLRVVCVDLDGTLSNDDERRRRFAPPQGSPLEMWLDYHQACVIDTPMHGAIATVRALAPLFKIHIISGRWDVMRRATEAWLANHAIPYDELRMYANSDSPTKNYIYKVQYLDMLRQRGYQPVLFLENEPAVAKYIETEGAVPVLCVNPHQAEVSFLRKGKAVAR